MLKMVIRLSMLTVLLALLLPVTQAQNYPPRLNRYINDMANVINNDYYENIRSVLIRFQETRGAEMVVLTVNTKAEFGAADQSIQEFATNVFNSWGVGDSSTNDGVLIVLAVTDRETYIAVGDGYGATMDAPLSGVYNEMRSYFADYDYSQGLYIGVVGAARAITGLDLSQEQALGTEAAPATVVSPTAGPSATPTQVIPTATVAVTGLPERTDPYFNSAGDVVSAGYVSAIRNMLKTTDETKNVRMTVLVIGYVNNYMSNGDTDINQFTRLVYNDWDLGGSNPTILMVVALWQNQIWVIRTPDETTFDPALRSDVENASTRLWVNGDRDGAIYAAVKTVIQDATGKVPADTYQPGIGEALSGVGTTLNNIGRSASQNPIPFLAVPVVGLGAFGVGLRRWMRYRPRKCDSCGTKMVLLDEATDDNYLDTGQRMEESLGSVNYDVWECPSCKSRTFLDYKNWTSGLSECPQCNYRTLSTRSTVVDHATTYSTGLRQVTQTCNHCNYNKSWEETIPMVQKHDNDNHFHSSSSSFGSSSSSSSSSSSHSSSGGHSSGHGSGGKF